MYLIPMVEKYINVLSKQIVICVVESLNDDDDDDDEHTIANI